MYFCMVIFIPYTYSIVIRYKCVYVAGMLWGPSWPPFHKPSRRGLIEARGNGFYGIDPLNTSLRKYGQQALLRRPTVFNGNNGNKDTSKEENKKKTRQHSEQYNKVTDNTDKPTDEISSLVHSEFLSIISIPFPFRTLPGYHHCTSLIPAYTDDFHFVFSTN